ncbi:MAG TPA: hypothetical protein VJX69_14720 [Terriglobales bacterium]|nr:hypothetical protein [Terriglobales bacterium]
MAPSSRKWLPAIVFWGLFGISLAFYKRYPWLDTLWYGVAMLFLLMIAGYSIIQIVRRRHETTTISYRGVPRWLEKFSLDEKDPSDADTTANGNLK